MKLQRRDFRFTERLRVRWVEIDAQQIVFNGHYLAYADTAMGGYWRALALPYAQTMSALDGDFFVRKASLDYLASARYDDLLEIGVRCVKLGKSSMQMQFGMFRADELLVHGELVYVFADGGTQTSKPIPDDLRAILNGFEAGEPMLDLRLGSWRELGAAAGAIRQAVFVDEQKIPAEMEWDAADETCLHALACNRLGQPLATGRLLVLAPGVGKIGRMAVLRALRGSQIGRQVLDALVARAREQGWRELLLHAQLSAENFYLRAGFARRGAVFEEAGIGHVEMFKAL